MHQNTKDEILKRSTLFDVLEEHLILLKSGSQFYAKCPNCGIEDKKKGFKITKSKDLAKCFSCGYAPGNPFKFLRDQKGMENHEIWDYLQQKYNVVENIYIAKSKNNDSFCSKQLKSSGLSSKDVIALVQTDKGEVVERDPFTEGTKDQYGNVTKDGDDMIIWYYGLDGKPVYYTSKYSRVKKPQRFYRVRWAMPDDHTDKNGNPIKYQSPSGSGTHLYIPQKIRTIYNKGGHIETLYLQEGEKKAEKACKHNILSVGLNGINSIGQNGKLPHELQLIVKTCNVKNVVLVFDADWNDISSKPTDGFYANQRPDHFYYAARNFKDYFRAFTNMDIYLELYLVGLKDNGNDKGLDDLLANQLKGKENELLEDFNKTFNVKDGKGQYIEMFKISDMVDNKLRELWNLHDSQKFAEQHKEKLLKLKEFYFYKLKWKFDDNGEFKLAQPLLPSEQFYIKEDKLDKDGVPTGKYTYSFDYFNNLAFLRNRGFWKIRLLSDEIKYIKIDNRVLSIVDSYYIADYALNFAKESVQGSDKHKVMNMLLKYAHGYYGQNQLNRMDLLEPKIETDDKYSQKMYFQKEFWHITADKIDAQDYSNLENYVWKDKVNDFEAKRLEKPLLKIENVNNTWFVDFSENADKCHFLNFIWDTGDFYWRKHKNKEEDVRSDDEKAETALQFIAKMSAMGYLLHTFFDAANPKAVIGMDGKLSEVGKSNGGSGKSLLGEAIGHVVPFQKINGKVKDMESNKHLTERVTEKTDVVMIDDVRVNFDFEHWFPAITGSFEVNPKGFSSYMIPMHLTPKLYIPTNHSLNGEGSSFRRRQFTIPFSDFYNDNYSPRDQFGVTFFTEWDYEQWNLFYNFAAECVQVYLKYGFVEAPTERLEQRRLRQAIGEDFIDWADEYFGFIESLGEFQKDTNPNIENDIPRTEMFDKFKERLSGASRGFWKTRRHKEALKKYCIFRGARFNPNQIHPNDADQQIGPDNKTGGVEYFQVAPIYKKDE